MPVYAPPPPAYPQPQWAPPAPPPSRNPLLIPGIIFGVVALLLVGAVIVYAAVGSGGDPGKTSANGTPAGTGNPVAVAPAPSDLDTADPTTAPTPTTGGSATASAQPSRTAPPCMQGVWLEQSHAEQITVLNTGTFLFNGSGTYQRYSELGRATFDYGTEGVHLTGNNGRGTNFDYVFKGLISYQYKFDNGTLTFTAPRADGTETFVRNGNVDYNGKLELRVPRPMKVNCGPVAMSLSNDTTTIELKRTSPVP